MLQIFSRKGVAAVNSGRSGRPGPRALAETVSSIRARSSIVPRIGIILGSGLGDAVAFLSVSASMSYEEIPHFPRSGVEGHRGRLLLGSHAGKDVVVMQGRFHLYEGLTPSEVTFPVRVMDALGVRSLIVTTAAGGIRADLGGGDVMLITDHINLMGVNPLAARAWPGGPRFVDMSDAYAEDYLALADRVARELGFALHRGVHVAVTGPTYETPAEIRMCRTLGADSVSMSLVPEVIMARSLGIKVLGLACITNKAAGHRGKISHEDVLASGAKIVALLGPLLERFCSRLAA